MRPHGHVVALLSQHPAVDDGLDLGERRPPPGRSASAGSATSQPGDAGVLARVAGASGKTSAPPPIARRTLPASSSTLIPATRVSSRTLNPPTSSSSFDRRPGAPRSEDGSDNLRGTPVAVLGAR